MPNKVVAWNSNNPSVASVSSSGVLTAISAGSVVITATCEGITGATALTIQPIPVGTLTLRSYISPSVTLFLGGVANGSLTSGATTTLTANKGTLLEWKNPTRYYSNGSPMYSDLTGDTLRIVAGPATTEISNIVQGVPYFFPIIRQTFSDTISFMLEQSTGVRCLGWQWGIGTYNWAYYRLDAKTNLRVYKGSSCAGNYVYWTTAQLANYETKTGLINLLVTSPP